LVKLPGISHNTTLTHPDLVVTNNLASVKERYLYNVAGIGPEMNLRINNADINTLKTALLTRMYYCEVNGEFVAPPQPQQQTVNAVLSDFRSELLKHTRSATPVSLDEVVEMYKGRKRTIYANAHESLKETNINRADAVSIAFVKCEKVNPTKAPRCIQPRDPRYNLVLGSYIKPIEHKLYKAIRKVFGDGPTVIKGYNVKEVATIMTGKWNSFNKPVAIGLDATKFDMHVSASMLNWEHSIYKRIYNGDQMLNKLLSWQLNNVGKGYCDDGKLQYKVKGKRFSGDMNTALGNCIIMCAMVWSYARSRGVDIKLMNNGDDCVVFMESSELSKFQDGLDEWFLALGFRMTVEEPCYALPEIEFCQMRCIRTANGPVMVRNIPVALSKDAMCIIPLETESTMRKWLGAVGECGVALCDGVPVMQSYYNMYCRNGVKDSKISESVAFRTGVHMLMQGMVTTNTKVSEEAREDVYIAWGIPPDAQIDLELQYDNMGIDFGDEEISDYTEVDSMLI